jgi:D-alanyl-D-alanine carboxypeptidase/D-alanyl-D-alanine-endopeptidase (penicillin-binding protein 4)
MRSSRWRGLKPSRYTPSRHAVVCSAMALAIASGCAKPRPTPPTAPVPTPLQQLQKDFDALIDQPGHQHGIWGIVVHSLTRNQRLYERNPSTLLVPASAMKLVSVAAGSEAVGWEFAFETKLLATGPIVGSVLQGDLVVVGNGDPSILGRAGDDALTPWVDALRARGITRVDGRVIADDDALEEPAPGFIWSWDDLGYPYGALPGALNLAENIVRVTVTPATLEGLPPTLELPADARDFRVLNRVRTGAAGGGTNVWPEFRAGESALSLSGSIAVGDKPAAVSVAAGNPTEWVARSFRNRLLNAGIDVTGAAVDVDDLPVRPAWQQATLLHTHRSRSLAEIAKALLKDSINLYAEAVLRLASGPQGVRTTAAGLDAVRARLESWGIPKEGIQVVDGSGLSRRNVIAPETLVAILARFYDASGASPFMQAQAIAGRDGTLATRMRGTPAETNAIGKTGSMSNVRTFAGYVRSAEGEELVFAIMANNFEGPASGVTATIDRLVARLASFSRAAVSRESPAPASHVQLRPAALRQR